MASGPRSRRTQDEIDRVWISLNRLVRIRATKTSIEEEKSSIKEQLGLSDIGFDYYKRELTDRDVLKIYNPDLSFYSLEEKRGIELAQIQKQIRAAYDKVNETIINTSPELQDDSPESERVGREPEPLVPFPNFRQWATSRYKNL